MQVDAVLQTTRTPGSLPGVFVFRDWIQVMLALVALVLLPVLLGCSSATRKPAEPPRLPPPVLPVKADRLLVEKSRHLLTVYRQGQVLASFPVALGREPVGPKTCQGDNRTPEGLYAVLQHQSKSAFHRALRLSYPSAADYERARRQGCKPGGDIVIHGLENGYGWVGTAHRSADWTSGCIAVTNEEMDQLWSWVPDGTIVEIRP